MGVSSQFDDQGTIRVRATGPATGTDFVRAGWNEGGAEGL